MKSLFANADFGMVGLILFFCIFMGIVAWLFMPGMKEKLDEHGNIPLKDDDNE